MRTRPAQIGCVQAPKCARRGGARVRRAGLAPPVTATAAQLAAAHQNRRLRAQPHRRSKIRDELHQGRRKATRPSGREERVTDTSAHSRRGPAHWWRTTPAASIARRRVATRRGAPRDRREGTHARRRCVGQASACPAAAKRIAAARPKHPGAVRRQPPAKTQLARTSAAAKSREHTAVPAPSSGVTDAPGARLGARSDHMRPQRHRACMTAGARASPGRLPRLGGLHGPARHSTRLPSPLTAANGQLALHPVQNATWRAWSARSGVGLRAGHSAPSPAGLAADARRSAM